jgi:hypothetical protein
VTLHARSDVTSFSSLAGHTHDREDNAERLVLDCEPCELEIQADTLWKTLWSDDPTVLPLTPAEQHAAERRERAGTRAMAEFAEQMAVQARQLVEKRAAGQTSIPTGGEPDLAAAIAAATPNQLAELERLVAERKTAAAATPAAPAEPKPARGGRSRQPRQGQ